MESDSLVVVQSIRSQTTLFFYFGRIIGDCRVLLFDLTQNLVSLSFVK